jgi:hypothetical protein
MIYVVIYEEGSIYIAPVNLSHLPQTLQDVYEPFNGKIVTWDHGEIKEYPAIV